LGARADIISMSRIMNLIVSFEMEEENFEYTVRSTYRFLYTKEKIYKFENIVLDFIRKQLPKIKTQKELMNGFINMHSKLLPLIDDPLQKAAFHNFDIIAWLESKIEGKPFSEMVKNKIKLAQKENLK